MFAPDTIIIYVKKEIHHKYFIKYELSVMISFFQFIAPAVYITQKQNIFLNYTFILKPAF